MDELPPDSTPDAPQEPQTSDGWELVCIGILRNKFGRRPSRALEKAMMQLSAEKAWREGRAEAARASWWGRIKGAFDVRPGLRLAFGAAVVLGVVAFSWLFFSSDEAPRQAIRVMPAGCKFVEALNARWSGGVAFRSGASVPTNELHLDSGVVEFAFASGAKAAVEGPAVFKLMERNGIELTQGKISAEVPKPAAGFTVRTPNATVVDLGTRFGVNANSQDSSEVDVFEGKVHVTDGRDATAPNNAWDLTRNMAMVLDNRGGVTAVAAAETAFPQIGHSVLIRPADCGFDASGFSKIGGLPTTFGFWSGPAFVLTGATNGVRPVQGKGMLKFLPPPQGGQAVDSVVWQLVDLHPAREFMTTFGVVDLKAWVQFNRAPGDSRAASKFSLTIAAFHGRPENAAALWAARNQKAVAIAEKELVADNDPRTWERVEVATTVTAAADFAIVEMRAIAPPGTPAGVDPFPGHFADLIDAKVCLPLRASSSVTAR
jgi:FecR protein